MDDGLKRLIDYVTVRINKATGNVFDQNTMSMVETRLNRRILELKLDSPEKYLSYLNENWEAEEDELIGLLTTHHTFFFREIVHFEFIQQNIERIAQEVRAAGRDTIRVWSAAASKGQEAYSLAFLLDKILPNHVPDLKYEVIASDIDPASVDFGERGVYQWTEVKEIPSYFLAGNWERNNNGEFARVKENIKRNVHFETMNLLELKKCVGKFDLIFCRNVLIYFDPSTVRKVVSSLEEQLFPNGYLITGVSEPIGEVTVNMERVGPCIYGFKNQIPTTILPIEKKEKKYRIVNVDDSPTVLKVLKKIFEDDERFEIVGQCENGEELENFLDLHDDIDLITLDLHMPVMDGVTYLEKNMSKKGHPPVIVLSSVNRENQELGNRAVQLGAEDYIEKPNFKNFKECGDQLKIKIVSLLSLAAREVKVVETHKREEVFKEKLPVLTETEFKHKNLHLIYPTISKMEPLLKEIVESGVFPEVFVVPTEEHIGEVKLFVEDFLSHYSFKGMVPEYRFYTKLKYIQDFQKEFCYPGLVFCFFQGSDLLHYLGDKINKTSYVLSEESLHNNGIDVESMPSTSWGFHIVEFLDENTLGSQTLHEWNDFKDSERVLPLGHQILVFLKGTRHLSFFINEDMRTGLIKVKEILEKNKGRFNSFKYIGPKKTGGPLINLCKMNGLKAVRLYEAQTPVRYKFVNCGVMLKRIMGEKKEKKPFAKSTVSSVKENNEEKIKVLVVDDSPTMTKVISRYLEKDPHVECVSIHHNIQDLERDIALKKPDVITLDMNMPEMTGDQVFEEIIKKYNIPTILLTSNNPDSKSVLRALNSGVWDYIQKPSMKEFNESKSLIEKIKLAKGSRDKLQAVKKEKFRLFGDFSQEGYIFIGSSTGGTNAVGNVLSTFPEEFPATFICQHIPEKFSRSFAELLDETNPFKVKEMEDGEIPEANTVYICPGGVHSEFIKKGDVVKVRLQKEVVGTKFIPSIDHFFQSFSKLNYEGPVTAAILTGMGKDGVKGLLELKNKGYSTLSQDRATSVVYGMPKVAYESGASQKQVPLEDIASTLLKNFKKNRASA